MKRFLRGVFDFFYLSYAFFYLALTWPHHDRADLCERDSRGE